MKRGNGKGGEKGGGERAGGGEREVAMGREDEGRERGKEVKGPGREACASPDVFFWRRG